MTFWQVVGIVAVGTLVACWYSVLVGKEVHRRLAAESQANMHDRDVLAARIETLRQAVEEIEAKVEEIDNTLGPLVKGDNDSEYDVFL